MGRESLLSDVRAVIEGAGFEKSPSVSPMTYQEKVRVQGLISGDDIIHFRLNTALGSVCIIAKYQESSGTADEKIGHSILLSRTVDCHKFIIVCGGEKLVREAIDYVNSHREISPSLIALEVNELEDLLFRYYL